MHYFVPAGDQLHSVLDNLDTLASTAASDSTSWVPASSYISIMNKMGLRAQLAQWRAGRALQNGTTAPLFTAAWPYTFEGTGAALGCLCMLTLDPWTVQERLEEVQGPHEPLHGIGTAYYQSEWSHNCSHTSHSISCRPPRWPLGLHPLIHPAGPRR